MDRSGVTATLSLELELGHGIVRAGTTHKLSERRERETERLRELLALCDEFDVTLTFNVVGHLLLEEPLADYKPHLYPDGWFDPIPWTGLENDPLFYAPDLVKMIVEAGVDHEVCTHTFSHLICDQVPAETVRYDLRQASRAHEAFDLDAPTSLVPPQHAPPPRNVLTEMGFEILRVPQYERPGTDYPPTRLHRAYDIVFGKHPSCAPRLVDGVVESYSTNHLSIGSSMLPSAQAPPHQAFRTLPVSLRRWLHYRNLIRPLADAAPNGFVHYWSHLYDISNPYQFPQIKRFIKEIANQTDVNIQTMAQLNDEIRDR